MNIDLYSAQAISDIGTLVNMQIEAHKESYIKYAELVAKSKLGSYSLNGELREWCPIIDVQKTVSGKSLLPQNIDIKKIQHYANLDETAQYILQEHAKKLQMSEEMPLINKEFNRWNLEKGYKTAQERPYVIAGTLVFFGSAIASAIALNEVLPYDRHINTAALSLIMGTMIGGVGWVAESWYHPLGKVLKPLEKLMMLDYELKDMKGTSIYRERLDKQDIKKLSQHLKKNYLENKMRA